MGKKVKRTAEKLGLTKLPLTVLYARPRRITMEREALDDLVAVLGKFDKTDFFGTIYIPDIVIAVGKYCRENLKDPSFRFDNSGSRRDRNYYLLVPESNLYVEVIDRVAGVLVVKTRNHVTQIKIYTDSEEHAGDIAQIISSIFEGGVLDHINWENVERKFKVKREECIATWRMLLKGK